MSALGHKQHSHSTSPCPLYPRKRTLAVQAMSAKGHKRTWRLARKCLNVFNLNNNRS